MLSERICMLAAPSHPYLSLVELVRRGRENPRASLYSCATCNTCSLHHSFARSMPRRPGFIVTRSQGVVSLRWLSVSHVTAKYGQGKRVLLGCVGRSVGKLPI
jgi:hypothetical protein